MKLIRMILIAVMCFFLMPFTAVRADSSEPGFTGHNINAQNYDRWTSPMRSNLVRLDSGYMIVNANSGSDIKAAYYDNNYVLERTVSITDGLPLFGGFHAGSDGFYYIVTGQTNSDESADVECYRVTKYDSSWNRIGSAGLYDCNTTVPFDAGSCRMADYSGWLLIRTCHEMYKSSDGYNHQANVTIQVDTNKMEITDSYTGIMSIGYGYVSHSFNQFIAADNDHIVAVDHGDAYPRSAVLTQYNRQITSGSFLAGMNTCKNVNLITFAGSIGANTTNASVGGLEVSSTHYLTAGNSAAQETDSQKTRNIFVASSGRSDISATQIHWLTSLEETGSYTLTTPKLVDLKNDTFMVLWADTGTNYSYVNPDTVYWTIVDHEGNPITEIMTGNGILTDCDPVVYNNKVIWYMHSGNSVYFEEIDLSKNTLEMIQAKRSDWKEVMKITPNETDLYLSLNEGFTLTAVIEPEDADDAALYFTSMDPSIATVSSSGYVRPAALGETVIRISTSNGVYADCKVTVVPSVSGISYSYLRTEMEVGETQTWTITVSPEDAQPYLRFISSDPSVITVDQNGLVTAVGPGEATVKAAVGQWGITRTVTVTAPQITSIAVQPSEVALQPGESAQLTAVILPESLADTALTWTSSDASIATVDSKGYVTAQDKEGTVIITASDPATGVSGQSTVTVKKHVHTYEVQNWVWASDYSTAVANLVCKEDSSHTLSLAADITSEKTEPTCTSEGKIVYTASVTAEGQTFTDSKTVVLDKIPHSYGEPAYSWSADNSKVTASVTCSMCSEKIEETVNTSYELIKTASCEEEGSGKYTATFTNSMFTAQTKEVALPALGHDYEVQNWLWASDYGTAVVNLVCKNDSSHTLSLAAVITSERTEPTCTSEGKIVYTAKAEDDGKTYTDSKTVILEKIPHSYGTPSYTWSSDNSKVTASVTCSLCGEKIEETVSSSYTSLKEASCTADGSGRYTASFSNSMFTAQTKEITIPALGHAYTLQSWNWSDDLRSASALFVCDHDESHTQTVNATVTVSGDTSTAAVTFEGKTYTSTRTADKPSPVSISLNRTAIEMATLNNVKLTASIQPSDADQSVTWTSSDENVARVDSTGKVTTLRYGTVTITATSKADTSLTASCTIQTRFYDVNDSSKYYYKPVYWAADNGITTGYDRVYFGPQQNCTRRELSIFLWRLAGKPAVSGYLPFSDLGKYTPATDTYKAILWCYTNGIVKGYSDGTFRPDNPIVRKDTMIMLYRLAGKPSVSGTLKFPDARALGYGPETDTYKSIVWGTQLEITKGYSDGSFKPLANCLREHIVTFVYRYDQKYN